MMIDAYSSTAFAHASGNLATRWRAASGRCRVRVLLAAALAHCGAALAEQPQSDATYFEELPVVLSASRLKQSVSQAPAAVTVLDRETILAAGVRTLEEALRMVPGFYLGHVSGNMPVVGYHGLTDAFAKRMQVLVDGVSIYSPTWGGIDWTELPLLLQDIERVEVVRGPNSAVHGANAFLATINIVTRDPAIEAPASLVASFGGNGIRDVAARLAGSGDGWRWRGSFGQRYDDGVAFLPDSSRIDIANLRAHLRLTPVDELSLQARASAGREGQGFYNRAIDDTQAARPRDVRQHSFQARWTRAWNGDDEFWLQAYHQQRSLRENLDVAILLRGLPPVPYNFNFDTAMTRDDLEFQATRRLNDRLRVVWGGQWRLDAVRSPTLFNTAGWVGNHFSRLFGNLEWRPGEQLAIHGGAMFERNSLNGNAASPRLAATYRLAQGHALRGSVTRANRAPTLYEARTDQRYWAPPSLAALAHGVPLKITVQSLEPLEDEFIVSRELGYVGELPRWQLSGDIRLYRDKVGNFVYSATTRQVTALFNSKAIDFFNQPGDVRERGCEVSVNWRPWHDVRIHATAAQTRIASDVADTLQSAPRHTRTLLVEQKLPSGLTVGSAYYKVGSMRWQNSPAGVPAYETVDLRFAYVYRREGHRTEVAAVARNVLGSHLDYNRNNLQRHLLYVQLTIGY